MSSTLRLVLALAIAPAFVLGASRLSDICSSNSLEVCKPTSLPTGFSVQRDPNTGAAVGISIISTISSPCSQQQEDAAAQLAKICSCSSTLAKRLKKAPALARPGSTRARDHFTGVSAAAITEIVAAEACLADNGVVAVDLNKQQLLDKLASERSLKVLSGITSFQEQTLEPALGLPEFLDMMNKAAECLPAVTRLAGATAAAASDPAATAAAAAAEDGEEEAATEPAAAGPTPTGSASSDFPPACNAFVDGFSVLADSALRGVAATVSEVMRLFVVFLSEVEARLAEMEASLQLLASPSTFLAEAEQAAADKGCFEPFTCFGGLLGEVWSQLQVLLAPLDSEQAVAATSAVAEASGQFKGSVKATFCELVGAVSDAEQRRQAVLAAFAQSVKQNELRKKEDLVKHIQLFDDMLVQLADLPMLQRLEYPAFTLRSAAVGAQKAVDGCVPGLQGNYAKALTSLSTRTNELLAMLPGSKPPATCPDGGGPRATCQAASCSELPPAEVQASLNASSCPQGSRCVVDGCAQCRAACVPAAQPADVSAALQVVKAWIGIIRASLKPAVDAEVEKASGALTRLQSGLDYLYAQGTSPAGGGRAGAQRAYMYASGRLSYNREGSWEGEVPCQDGFTSVCYSADKLKACAKAPVITTCPKSPKIQIPLSNKHIPWVKVHEGLVPVLLKALGLMSSTGVWKPSATDLSAAACTA